MYDGSIIQDRDVDKIPSKRRNPVIADLFHRLSFMERRGSGLKKIRDEYKKAYEYSKSYEPEFCSTRTDFTTILQNLNYSKKKSGSESHPPENVGINVGITEGRVIELIRSNEHITIQTISENLKISRR